MVELVAVVAIVGLMAGMATLRWSGGASSVSAEGFARSLALTLSLARQQAIAEGDPVAVIFARDSSSSQVISARLHRVTSGGDVAFDNPLLVPSGLTVSTAHDRWEFNYSGSLTTPAAGGTLTLTEGVWTYTLSVNAVTGSVSFARTN